LINIKVNEEMYTVVNIYAPNCVKARIDFLKKSKTWIKRYTEDIDRLIISGDINCSMDKRDRKRENGDKSNSHLIYVI
jgi:exonuclease III